MSAQTKRRAPYRAGDKIRILYADPIHGTCLGTATIEQISEAAENGKWTITYRHPLGDIRTALINERGTDRHAYIERAPK
jgi:hypothetical protein